MDQLGWPQSICMKSLELPSMSSAHEDHHIGDQHAPANNNNTTLIIGTTYFTILMAALNFTFISLKQYISNYWTFYRIHKIYDLLAPWFILLNWHFTHFCNRLKVACGLQLVDTMALRFAIGGSLGNWALAATTAHTDSEDNKTYNKTWVLHGKQVTRLGYLWASHLNTTALTLLCFEA